GVDALGFRTPARIRAAVILPRVFCEFFRRETLRDEGGLAAHRRLYAPALLPQLVPGALPVCIRDVSLRGRISKLVANPVRESKCRHKPHRRWCPWNLPPTFAQV